MKSSAPGNRSAPADLEADFVVTDALPLMPLALEEIVAQAGELADAFEACEPVASDEGRTSSLVALRLAASRRAEADRAVLAAVVAAREHASSPGRSVRARYLR